MNYPTLPTDTLYKFMALSGLVITLLSAWFLLTRVDSLKLSLIALRGDANGLTIEEEFLRGEQQELKANSDGSRNDQRELRQRAYELQLKVNLLQTKLTKANALLGQITEYRIFLYVSIFFGLNLTYWGFRLWYIRIQKLQDAILRRQAGLENTDQN